MHFKIRPDGCYELLSPETYTVDFELPGLRNGLIQIRPAESKITLDPPYAWNGPSGPGIDTANSLRASAIHDAGYFLISVAALPKSYRKHFDRLYRLELARAGVGVFRRWYHWAAVRIFGGAYS